MNREQKVSQLTSGMTPTRLGYVENCSATLVKVCNAGQLWHDQCESKTGYLQVCTEATKICNNECIAASDNEQLCMAKSVKHAIW